MYGCMDCRQEQLYPAKSDHAGYPCTTNWNSSQLAGYHHDLVWGVQWLDVPKDEAIARPIKIGHTWGCLEVFPARLWYRRP
ncbi:hypothetical protein EJ05DRAFT_234658 [Pseudovirgaria hyperparasitica]|uniref:Uncharacterized protein n=1 Tax=Pseudovirgaria hyperparasitica TaxID=470096 RepID=A0A6A6VST4_9PEZI|nr:uncharacterized protein EJ05DRAFT_234658 [Pseudovirgaria hyperparasitica]KAF2752939.1 hypothetical protein EJ05DRAFT_234658 [Pseudovirgaria hyperparasitica]